MPADPTEMAYLHLMDGVTAALAVPSLPESERATLLRIYRVARLRVRPSTLVVRGHEDA